MHPTIRSTTVLAALFASMLTAPVARADDPTAGAAAVPEQTMTVKQAQDTLNEAAKEKRAQAAAMTFEQFKDKMVYQEPGEDGKFIVDGDTPIASEKALREFFEQYIKNHPGPGPELIIHVVGGQDAAWNSVRKHNLSYCVSTSFGRNYRTVVLAMRAATRAWEEAADINFRHVVSEDGNCTASNRNVEFDVRPVNANGQFLARAFFPNEARRSRNVLIDDSSFRPRPPGDTLTLTGILRHELGHTLGFRHEHTRPEAGTCFEDTDFRILTDYDAFSVMHYPQCNGEGDFSLTLTQKDIDGVACVYGPAPNRAFDPSVCGPGGAGGVPTMPAAPVTETFDGQSVQRNRVQRFGPFKVAGETLFTARMTGSGDPDLYVRFDNDPTPFDFACRPFTAGATEECELDVPVDAVRAHVMVRGYQSGNFDLEVTHTPPAS